MPARSALYTVVLLASTVTAYTHALPTSPRLRPALNVPHALRTPHLIASEDDQRLQAELAAMSERSQQRGLAALTAVCAVVVWVFTLPPEIRRAEMIDPAAVLTHYQTCGGGGSAPCVQLDLSIDPTKVAASQAVLDTVLDAVDAGE